MAAMKKLSPNLRISEDQRTNALFFQSEGDFQKVEDLLHRIDAPGSATSNDVLVRLVWLIETPGPKDKSTAIPADLAPSIDALRKKIGLGELVTAAQTIVRCSPDGAQEFEASGTSKVEIPFSYSFGGRIKQALGDRYQLEIHGTMRDIDNGTPVSNIQTRCSSIQMSQPVILGTTAINSRASVLVIQLLE
jgi:hypothetical protein